MSDWDSKSWYTCNTVRKKERKPSKSPPKAASKDGNACLRLGEFLVANGSIKESELKEALLIQQRTGRKLGAILVSLSVLTEDALCQELSRRLDIPYFDLADWMIDPKVVQAVPEHLCERYRLIPLKKSGNRLTVAMINPFDEMALEDLKILTGFDIRPVLATPSAISRALADAYGAINYAKSIIESMATKSGRLDLKERLYRILEHYERNPPSDDE